jgi:FkbM family methyltransferase
MKKFTRESYINSPCPIEAELKTLFAQEAAITIFDIGSCEGEDSIRYSRLFPSAKIYAFEPLPQNLAAIRANLAKYAAQNIEIIPIALADRTGKQQFFVSSGSPENAENTADWDYGNKSSSLLEPDRHLEHFPWLKFRPEIEVDVDTLENVCEQQNIELIDFIHMDVQGAELKVLEGAGSFIEKIKVIWMEVEAVSLYKNQPLKDEVEKFMKQHRFLKLKDTVNSLCGDQLYVNLNYCDSWLLRSLNLLPGFRPSNDFALSLIGQLK